MSIVAFLTDAFAIRKILDHLGLSTPEADSGSDPNPSLTAPARAA